MTVADRLSLALALLTAWQVLQAYFNYLVRDAFRELQKRIQKLEEIR